MKTKRTGSIQYRNVTLPWGQVFSVPEHINRLDSRKTHGWQIRYGKSTKESSFPDGTADGSGAAESLSKAVAAYLERVRKIEAPTGLRQVNSTFKTSDLPTGVSGPAERIRKGKKIREYYFQVSFPRFGDKSANRSIYIGTENTISQERIDAAQKKAVQIRIDAENLYQRAITKSVRAKHEKG